MTLTQHIKNIENRVDNWEKDNLPKWFTTNNWISAFAGFYLVFTISNYVDHDQSGAYTLVIGLLMTICMIMAIYRHSQYIVEERCEFERITKV